jgi:uncharacterized iron-regulated protein
MKTSLSDQALNLAIGDPVRKDREASLVLDGITDCARGDLVTPPEMAARLDGVRLLFVGESHTDMEFHKVQLRVIQELHERGRQVLLGLEMYPTTEQPWLDRWSPDKAITEEGFLKESHWYGNWGYHWDYYRGIFLFARTNGIRMFGVNVPRTVVQTMRMRGFDALTPEQKTLLPARIDTESIEHRQLFRAFFGPDDALHGSMPPEMFEGMFRAQCTWDAAMGANAVQALGKHGSEKAIMVVLIGSGHVAYGLGAERQAKLWFDGRTGSLIPVGVADPEARQPISRVRASYANFVWGVPPVTDPIYPTLGISTPVDLRPEAERTAAIPLLLLPQRRALAELPPVFSQKALVEHVTWLAAPEREGRGLGSKGLEAAADYVGAQMKAMGLQPGGDGGTFFHSLTSARSPSGSPVVLRNVIGVLPGTKAEWKGQSALLTAHYDHLGRGWPDVHKGDEGRLHPGADDNASGVAVMLELARALASGEKPQRTLVFVAFAGEEASLLGSRHYVEHPTLPLDRVMGVINLDTVGRLGDRKLSVLATGTAAEWQHIFQGASYVTGVENRAIADSLESSDQKSFIDAGVPAVQIFTEAHSDYHRPGDTADKIDVAGLVKVATFVKEGLAYLAERPEPLTLTIGKTAVTPPGVSPGAPASGGPAPAAAGGAAGAPAGAGRRVSFGTVPDFAFGGPGVRVAGIVLGSPAERAGVKESDILLRVAGKDVTNLQGLSSILRGLTPGQTVTVVLRRGAEDVALAVTVVERQEPRLVR